MQMQEMIHCGCWLQSIALLHYDLLIKSQRVEEIGLLCCNSSSSLLHSVVLIKYPCLVGSKSIIYCNPTGILSVEPQPTLKPPLP